MGRTRNKLSRKILDPVGIRRRKRRKFLAGRPTTFPECSNDCLRFSQNRERTDQTASRTTSRRKTGSSCNISKICKDRGALTRGKSSFSVRQRPVKAVSVLRFCPLVTACSSFSSSSLGIFQE
ncbi:hypothetical protein EUGRSUZ_H03184 [Eucalyptus grandis]|uniref:Uncharacterized protein n=2 Tax=Eucalyptus grandis TaxID=71139 RepID=A0ACC3JUN6_EUCGR|nr:hypothetical protein EUGRSUZ_H03184 [Eucalyptus grandis]